MFTTADAQPEAKGRLAGFYLLHGALIILVILNLFPLVWMVATAFTPNSEVFEKAIRFLPDNPTLENFRLAFEAYPVASWFWNSFIISLAVAVGKLALATPAAFAFAHMRFKGRDLLFALVVGTMTVPYVVTIVPVYMGVARVGLFNTAAGVIIPSMAFCGFAVFFLRQNFLMLPVELFDAAAIDGAGPFRKLFLIALPNIMPALASIGVLSFLGAWNIYLWAQLVLEDMPSKTLAVGLKYFSAHEDQLELWGPLMAATLVGVLPVAALFVLAQRYVMSAFVSSGVKG